MGVTLTDEQRRALDRLAALLPADFYLGGGVAVAAHLHHRVSRDLDFFSSSDPSLLQRGLEQAGDVVVTGAGRGTLHLEINGVPVSLLQYPYKLVAPTVRAVGVPVPVASLEDLACMKLSAIAGRGAARDFWDLHEIIEASGRSLDEYVDVFQRKFPAVDPGHVVRSLAYFDDAESQPMPRGLTVDRWQAIRRDFEVWVKSLR